MSINTVLLFLAGPFKANSGFVYLSAVGYGMSWFETDSEFLEKKKIIIIWIEQPASAKWSVEELIYDLP